MFNDSINLIVLLDSIPVLRILAAISRLRAGNLFIRGPVDHDILCSAEDEHDIKIQLASNYTCDQYRAATPTFKAHTKCCSNRPFTNYKF